jgi:hypothetical protein
MLRRTTPSRIDSDYLRVSKIAPGNEYKVVGALRFLALIDDDGRPTDSSRLLKTKGATYTLALQDIVRNAYSGVFHTLKPKEITRDGIYNYFVTEGGLGAEMATKATRFLLRLCRLAEIEIIPDTSQPSPRGRRRTRQRQTYRQASTETALGDNGRIVTSPFPFVLALTPEMAQIRTALEQSLT